MSDVLTVNKLSVDVDNTNILRDITFSVEKGEILGVIGPSGAGKTTLAFAVSNLLNENYTLEGSIIFDSKNVLALDKTGRRNQTVKNIGIILQNAQSALDPYEKIGTQFKEIIQFKHGKLSDDEVRSIIRQSIEQVGLSDDNIINKYPSELSGGMKQRIVLAMALLTAPKILVADEPTSSLDGIHKLNFLRLLKEVVKKQSLSLLLISHDIALILNICDKILLLENGLPVAYGNSQELLHSDNSVIKDFVTKTRQLFGDINENS